MFIALYVPSMWLVVCVSESNSHNCEAIKWQNLSEHKRKKKENERRAIIIRTGNMNKKKKERKKEENLLNDLEYI
jgi:hypothetical protein